MPDVNRLAGGDPAAMPLQTRAAPLQSVDASARTVDVVFSTGSSVQRVRWVDWDETVPFLEELTISAEAVDLTRLNAGAAVLDSHITYATGAQVAVVERAWIDEKAGQAMATVRFPPAGVDDNADRMWGMVSNGIIRNVSVGYSIDEVRVIPAQNGAIERRIAERWTPMEISFVTVPADAKAQTRARGGEPALYPLIIHRAEPASHKEPDMPTPAPAATPADNAGQPVEARAAQPVSQPDTTARAAVQPQTQVDTEAALKAERIRVSDITKLCRSMNMPAEFGEQHIEAGTSIDEVRKLVLDDMMKRSLPINNRTPLNVGAHAEVVRDEGDSVREAVATAIMLRADPRAIKETDTGAKARIDAAREWRGMTLMEIGRNYLEETQGIRLRGLNQREMAGVLLGLEKRAGMLSTSDFPNILANVISKRLRDAYALAPQNWKLFSRQSNAPDFKEKAVVQLANLPKFKQVREGQNYSYSALSDGVEKYALATYGEIVNISRQTLINDDLGAFNRLPVMLGRAAAELEASIVWTIITGNPAMSDGNNLFSTQHKNLAASGAAITVSSLSDARAAMRKQKGFATKDVDAEPLNLKPKFLIVSPDKETEAQQVLASIVATAAGSVNPFAGSMTQVTEARLTGTAWYVAADPELIDTIEYAYLEGEEGLYTETRMGFEVDGMQVKGRLDFAAKAIDWRGFYKNPGA